MLARAHGLRFVAVVDPNVSAENVAKIRAFGGEVETAEDADERGYLAARVARVQELCAAEPSFVWTDQYTAAANPRAHQTGTAPELLRQLDHRLDMVFVAVSTCGTLAGVGTYLRQASPTTRIVAVDARGSVVFGDPPAPRLLVGIGSGRTPAFDIDGLYDDVVHVTDRDAFACCRALAAATGIHVGGSSGAVIAACLEVLRQMTRPCRVACICPDNGDNYLSTIWSDPWLSAHGIDASQVPGGVGFDLADDPRLSGAPAPAPPS
jgi:cysteine synthase